MLRHRGVRALPSSCARARVGARGLGRVRISCYEGCAFLPCARTFAPRRWPGCLCVRARMRARALTAYRDPITRRLRLTLTLCRCFGPTITFYRRFGPTLTICWRSRPPPPSALELRLTSRAPAPTPPGLVLMTGAGAACGESEADEEPPVEEGVLDAAMEDDTYTTLPLAWSARSGG